MKITAESVPLYPERGIYDLFVGVVGYESRSTWLLRERAIRAKEYLALRFGFNEVLHFADALQLYETLGAKTFNPDDVNPVGSLASFLDDNFSDVPESPTILLDISAMSRYFMAVLIKALANSRKFSRSTIIAHYAPAKFINPPPPVPLRLAGPVIPEFAGWSSRPEVPLAVVMGLGYETGVAAGALQYLEPSKTWVFFPVGPEKRYEPELESANDALTSLFDIVRLGYNVIDPMRTRGRLIVLARELMADYRVALIPFGPKIFAWLCTLTAAEDGFEEIGLWHFSAHNRAHPVNREAEGVSVWHAVTIDHTDQAESTEGLRRLVS